MSANRKVVLGIFQTRKEIEKAIDSLKIDGFLMTDISVLLPDKTGSQNFAHVKGTKAPEVAATGATSGALIGGTLGLLVGLGVLTIPGIGPFIAAGPLVASLAGAGVGGAIVGVSGALIGLSIPKYEAKRFEGFVTKGGILLSVHASGSDETSKAKRILEVAGGSDIASTVCDSSSNVFKM